jgi:hypothetical protein
MAIVSGGAVALLSGGLLVDVDYPAESDVRLGVDYADSTLTGSLAVAGENVTIEVTGSWVQ